MARRHALSILFLMGCAGAHDPTDAGPTDAALADAAPSDASIDAGRCVVPVANEPVAPVPARCAPGEVFFTDVGRRTQVVATLPDGFYGTLGFSEMAESIDRITPGAPGESLMEIPADTFPRRTIVEVGGEPLLVASSDTHMSVARIVTGYFQFLDPVWQRAIDNVRHVVGRPDGGLFVVTYGYEDPPAFQIFDGCGGVVQERTLVDVGATEERVRTLEVHAPAEGTPVFSVFNGLSVRRLWGAAAGEPLRPISPEGCGASSDALVVDGTITWAWNCPESSTVYLREDEGPVHAIEFEETAGAVVHVALTEGPDDTQLLVVAQRDSYVFEALGEDFDSVASGRIDFSEPEVGPIWSVSSATARPIGATLLVEFHGVVRGDVPTAQQMLVDVCPR